ncbi:hypothetical protein QW694_06345 [Methylobacterium isbiliense]|jgi:hypothetical protein|uniref:hypothetical protein n=1 Tax=Methylobacterium isbiliense TaxID=315478 RepID=UPI001EE2820A|nr:hypothetical protein [Methylobacterium isbiliense]MDN3622632.1 hypothetical protein [Methylobacterium isbiliense]
MSSSTPRENPDLLTSAERIGVNVVDGSQLAAVAGVDIFELQADAADHEFS